MEEVDWNWLTEYLHEALSLRLIFNKAKGVAFLDSLNLAKEVVLSLLRVQSGSEVQNMV